MRVEIYDRVKRVLDFAYAGVVLVLVSPIIAVVAVCVAMNLGRPVLFSQERPGRGGHLFVLRKFRTMRDVDTERGLIDDTDRLTRFGRMLRASSLDELPTLWNVLRGDMSFVGPRPLLPAYLSRYSPEQARRHEVRPGITGLAQSRGRNDVPWNERLRLDVEYVDTRSLRVDTRILMATAGIVARRQGVSATGHATMPEFRGTIGADE
ncbi:sugar transferase [Microbacterium sp. Root180]|uniref:sugar transferase n=1 Tax=Microbacterium sp. Root180 TaxID=1736483 RepID=UPI0006FDA10E|nr:sugar transferase [Microbacterium sp. Root180]KRB36255.1 UDP-galactose phosphate transferase [Microbacterium sp. Root180]